jgi:hypothetical protein
VVLTLHEILTRDPRYDDSPMLHTLDETELLAGQLEDWAQHPDVQLDPGISAADYFDKLARWVRGRRGRPIASYAEASAPLDWPEYMANPSIRFGSYDRDEAHEHGLPLVEWACPRSVDLDR